MAELQEGMIRSVQNQAWRNKLDKGFSTRDVPLANGCSVKKGNA